jgi:hypothetical protein
MTVAYMIWIELTVIDRLLLLERYVWKGNIDFDILSFLVDDGDCERSPEMRMVPPLY